jgi:hypothetical protein
VDDKMITQRINKKLLVKLEENATGITDVTVYGEQ